MSPLWQQSKTAYKHASFGSASTVCALRWGLGTGVCECDVGWEIVTQQRTELFVANVARCLEVKWLDGLVGVVRFKGSHLNLLHAMAREVKPQYVACLHALCTCAVAYLEVYIYVNI